MSATDSRLRQLVAHGEFTSPVGHMDAIDVAARLLDGILVGLAHVAVERTESEPHLVADPEGVAALAEVAREIVFCQREHATRLFEFARGSGFLGGVQS